jgi:acyl-CoA dehydrogenase
MMVVIISIIAIFSILGLLAIRGSFYSWLFFLSIITITLQFTKVLPEWNVILLWGMVFTGIMFSIDSIRQKLFSKHLLQVLKDKLPDSLDFNSIGQEEIPMVDGDVGIEADLLRGNLNLRALLQASSSELTAKEKAFLNNQVEALCQMLSHWKISQDKLKLPPQVWEYLTQHKFFAMNVPIEFGGLGFSSNARFEIVQKIATRSITVAVTVMVPNSIDLAKLLLTYGTKVQLENYLPKLVTGEYIPTLALDANQNSGVVCYQKYLGQEVLGVRLNWDESYIPLAPIATLLVLSIKLSDPNDFLCSNKKDLGKNICLVPTNLPNIFNNLKKPAVHQDFLNGPTTGMNVFVPLDFIVGSKELIGQSWNRMIDCLSIGKDMSFLALSVAISKLCLKNISAHSIVRTQMGLPIIQFAKTKANLAKIGGYSYMLDAVRSFVLSPERVKNCPVVVIAMVRDHITEISKKIVDATVDIYGSNVTLGIKNHLTMSYQNVLASVKIFDVNILQVIHKCHPFLQSELEAIKVQDIGLFDHCFFAHISYALSNFAKMLLHIGTNKLFCQTSEDIEKSCEDLNLFSVMLSCLVELSLLKLDVLLKQNEQLSRRLWDVFRHLCMGCAVIKYYNEGQNKKNPDELYFASWGLQVCLYNIQQATVELLQNFHNKFLGKLIYLLIYPFGKKYKMPNDELEYKISSIVTKNSDIRTKLLSGCYISSTDNLETAFKKLLNIEMLEQNNLKKETLTELETNLIKEVELAVKNATVIDEFST